MGSVINNLLRQVGTNNLKLSLTGTILSYGTYDGLAPTELNPIYVRFSPSDLVEIIEVPTSGHILDFGVASFGMPNDTSETALYIGVVKGGSGISLCVGATVTDSGRMGVAANCTRLLDVCIPAGVTPGSKVMWIAKVLGVERINGSWSMASATLVQDQ